MRILIDIDGTIADWGAEWDRHAAEYVHLGLKLTESQDDFDLTKGLSDEGRAKVIEIMNHPEFYRVLKPFEGAKAALNEMLDEGHEVHLVTSPWLTNQNCASDKLWWAEEYIGSGWAKRTIITSDKTVVAGDILIDDKPYITGSMTPSWEQVYFTQPYNKNIEGKRRLDRWSEWRDLTWRTLSSSELEGFSDLEKMPFRITS